MNIVHSYSALRQYAQCPLKYYRTRILKDTTELESEQMTYGKQAHAALEARGRFGHPLPQSLQKYETLIDIIHKDKEGRRVLHEQKLCIDKDLIERDWDFTGAWLRGIVDVLVIDNNSAVVFDYKTGRSSNDTTQLDIFSLLVLSCFPEVAKVRGSFIWLKENFVSEPVEYTRDHVYMLTRDVEEQANWITASLQNNNWPAKPSRLCNWCGCKPTCEYAK